MSRAGLRREGVTRAGGLGEAATLSVIEDTPVVSSGHGVDALRETRFVFSHGVRLRLFF